MPPTKGKRQGNALPNTPNQDSPALPLLAFLSRRSALLSLAFVLLASVRIAATYTVFNHTRDEPDHIACGIEWLDKGTYKLETQHPPLARVASVIFPYLAGSRAPGRIGQPGWVFEMQAEGLAVLYGGHRYELNLALARLGILPFFWIGCLVVFLWGKRYYGPAAAAAGVFFFSFLPPVLAHAGLATTDMALTALLGAAFLAAAVWAEQPTVRHAAWFGIAGGLCVLSKFSALPFFPAAVLIALAWYCANAKPKPSEFARAAWRRVPTLALAGAIAFFLVWAGYRFSFGRTDFAGGLPLPAPELFDGIKAVEKHNEAGHWGYLLGQVSLSGFWYYYPVVLAVKTPLAFLLLLGAAAWLGIRRRAAMAGAWLPVSFVLGILLVGLFSRINIGVRHVLPVYIGFSVIAACAAVRLLEAAETRRWVFYSLAAAALWFAGSSALSHPDYLAYFNELAGSQPEKILVDSDLDWGQDTNRLSKRLRELGATEVTFAPFISGDFPKEHGFPPIYAVDPFQPNPGWNAISVSNWKILRFGLWRNQLDKPLWPDRYAPRERVGKGILLYYFPGR